MGAAPAGVTRRVVAGAAFIVAVSAAAAWALGYPQSPLGGAAARAAADGAAVVAVGLAVVPMLDVARYRAELIRSATTPLVWTSAVWLLAEIVRLIAETARAADVGVLHLGVQTTAEFALATTAGRSSLAGVVAALALGIVTLAVPRTTAAVAATTGIAAAGLVARTLSGHLAESPVGGLAVAVHALAAALWCGTLAALVLTVTHRGQWARVLPRYSQLSLSCVVALLIFGVLGAAIRLNTPAELWATGYGRLLSAKVVLTAGLLVVAWRNRAGWLPAARSHRASATLSRTRSLIELAVMTVTITFAAALAVAG
ncbi:CopD family protein [Mycolicibacterium brisbanense]|uniref:Copper resistance D n=1 Tax=Mycolicibacterium brisbanense TaxID=146020 RepID=A0A100W3E9_9MYCO|nr:CopD family protein [Mycolicibacterium brisbanense]MCV7158325.1 CopD family protein [Mycolicibacterium brisbanense]GAS90927.1 copper resistance D [Mycolicibacterium brisbanense]